MSTKKMSSKLTYCFRFALAGQYPRFIHMGRIVPELDDHIDHQKIIEKALNPKKLPTRRNMGLIFLPAKLQAVAEEKLRTFNEKKFRQEAKYLIKVLSNIKLPDDRYTLKIKKLDIETKMQLRGKMIEEKDKELAETEKIANSRLSQMVLGQLMEQRRDWRYYEYDKWSSYLYMAARLAPNYSCIRTVMKEIHDLDPEFEPKSVLDFGSGMATTYWAVNETWPNTVSEFLNVDISQEQQYLAESLMRGGSDMGETPPGVFHRQYLPASSKVKYDMVVAAFSMLEIPTRESRANIIENLWHKTNDLLVLIERGNRGGFATINEARNFVLDLSGHDVTSKVVLTAESRPVFKHAIPNCHVFAPCSHEFTCPKMSMTTKRDMDICKFRVFYMPLDFGEMKPGYLPEEFSYVVLRKKPHQTYTNKQCPLRWPRIIEKRNKSNKQITHKLCCPNGSLATATITKAKYGKAVHEVAKACDWGDILPVKACDTYVVKNSKSIGST